MTETNVRAMIIEAIGTEVRSVEFRDVVKTNGVTKRACIIQSVGSNIAPSIYIDNLVDKSDAEATEQILNVFRNNSGNTIPENIIDVVSDKETVLPMLRAKLINGKKNKEYSENFVTKKFRDLSILVYIKIDAGSINVTKQMATMWGLDEAEIVKIAKQNTMKSEGITIKSLMSVMAGMLDEEIPPEMDMGMYVVTSNNGLFGAIAMTSKNFMRKVSNEKFNGNDFYIIPSSVHEILVLDTNGSVKDVKSMIAEVNNEHVDADEILSYSLYKYSTSEDKVVVL